MAGTLAARFDAHLREAAKDAGPGAHWELSEAQRLAPLVPGGVGRLEPVALKLATRARTPWLQGEALGTLAGLPTPEAIKVARDRVREAGALASGWVLGPRPGPGTSEPLATALQTEAGAWRRFLDAAFTGPLQLDDLVGPEGDVHAFLRFRFLCKKPTDAMLVASSNGALAGWLDQKPIVEWDGERRLSDWQHPIPVRLEAGPHELVLRVGHRQEVPELLLRLVDGRGRLPSEIAFPDTLNPQPWAGWTPSKALPDPLAKLAPADPALRGKLLLWASASEPQDREAARAFEEAIRARPTDPELHYLLGRAEASDHNRRRAAYEAALALSGGRHVAALGELLIAAGEAGLVADAEHLGRALGQQDPRHPSTLLHRAQRLAGWADAGAALGALGPASDLPYALELQTARASLLQGMPNGLAAATAWQAVAQLAGFDPGAVGRAVDLCRRAGRDDLALGLLAAARKHRPYAVEPLLGQARILADGGHLEAALRHVDEAATLAPHRPEAPRLATDLHLSRGDRGAAVAALDRALALQPQDRATADRRQALGAEASLAQRFAVPQDAWPHAAPGKTGYLLDKHAVVVFPSGLSSRFEQKLIAIGDPRGAQHFSRLVYPFTPGEERLEVLAAEVHRAADGTVSRPTSVQTVRPDGKQQGVYTLEAYRVLELGQLDPGDLIHVQLRRDEVGSRNLFGTFFGVLLPVADEWPRHKAVVEVEAPADRPLFAHAQGFPAPKRTAAEGTQRWLFEAAELPGLSVEPSMPGIGEAGTYVNLSTYQSWAELIAWYKELIRPQLGLSPELRTKVRELTLGAADLRAKVKAIHGFVVKSTRYVGIEFGIHGFKPYRVTQVLERGYGDCKDKASLLVALCREAGVAARFVLVRTRDLGQVAREPATLWAFNHAIAYIPDLDLYLDATDEHAALGELPVLDQGAFVLHFDPYAPAGEVPVLTTIGMAPPREEQSLSQEDLALDASGDARGRVREIYRGSRASQVRRRLQNPVEREADLQRLVARTHPGARVVRASYQGLDELDASVTVEVELELPGWARRVEGGLEVPLHQHPAELSERYGGDAERRWPLVIDHARQDLTVLTVTLPPGATLAAPPAPVSETTPFGWYRQTTRLNPEDLRVEDEVVLSGERVAPADYPAFRGFIQRIGQARAGVVRVTLPAATGTR
jgi:tetratricopeptide (TPR) repeat protein